MTHSHWPCLLGMALTLSLGLTASEATPTTPDLTLAAALQRALQAHPGIEAAQRRVEVARGHRLTAGLRPNPEAELEIEDLGGADGTTTTLRLGHALELGGKRGRRLDLADQDISQAEGELRLVLADLHATVAQAYLAALVAQERAQLAKEAAELAAETARVVREQADGGKVSPVMQRRAELAANRSQATAENARRQAEMACVALAAHWDGEVDFARLGGALGELASPPAADSVQTALAAHPALAVAAGEVDRRQADLALARTGAIPDLTVAVGVSRSESADDTTFSLTASVPLPIFDRNQGQVAATSAAIAEAGAELRAAKRLLTAQSRAVLARLDAEFVQATRLRDEILPAAREAFAAVRDGYAAGKLGYLDVLESREALFEIRADHLAALAGFHEARIELERLTAGALTPGMKN